jgi:hypothetical protein
MKSYYANIAKLLAVFFAAVVFLIPVTQAHSAENDHAATAVMAVEHQWLVALQRRDVKILDRILGREFIDSDFRGEAVSRTQYLAYFARLNRHAESSVRQTFADTMVRFVDSRKVAIVTGIVITRPSARSNAGASSDSTDVRHSRFTDVFIWRNARWQAVTAQETHFGFVKNPGERR